METGFPSAGGVLLFVGLVVVGLVVLIGAVALVRSRANTADRPPDAPAYTQATVRIANPIDEDVRAELLRQLQRGNKIEAIKLLREHTGVGLKEAKDAVEALERNAAAPLPAAAPEVPMSPHLASLDIDPEVRLLLQRGNKIAAIKRVRELTGWGLKESKDYVDRL